MSIPKPTFGPQGFVAPAQSDILTGIIADINAAMGGGVNPALNTPQGQLASSETAAIGAANDSFVYYASQVDPAFAQGRMQDGIGRIYFLQRNPAQPTTVPGVCIGAQGVTIPAGARVKGVDGNYYDCQQTATFGVSGTMTLPFACETVGPIPCPAGTLGQIYSTIPGWDTVTNTTAGVPGRLVESRTDFEARRAGSVAQNSLGWLPAIRGAVLAVPGVLDAFVAENPSGVAQLVGGVSLVANSLYVCVAGGAPAVVAQAIWSRKAPGCAYTGNTTVQVQDQQAGMVPPYPTYNVTYQTAAPLSILFSVVIANSPLVPANANVLIQNAIVAAFAGLDGGARARIGVAQLASRYYPTIVALGPWAQIVDITIGSINAPASTLVGSIAGNVLTVTAMGSGSGAIAVGQTLDDLGGFIVEGTQVLSQTGGTPGGVGTYTVSSSQTVASETMYGATANAFRVTPTIGQIPVISAVNIAVSVQ